MVYREKEYWNNLESLLKQKAEEGLVEKLKEQFDEIRESIVYPEYFKKMILDNSHLDNFGWEPKEEKLKKMSRFLKDYI